METIIVTGVGGGVGQSILKSLQGTGYRVIGVDGGSLAAGLFAVERAYQVPVATDPGFVDRMLEIAEIERCALIIPGLDPELPVFANSVERFRTRGIHVAVSAPEVIMTADDKLATANFLEANGFPYPRTCQLDEGWSADLPYPVILKPRRGGSRSLGVFVANCRKDLERYCEYVDAANYVAQEMIEGGEYTCGSIHFGGQCFGTITMRRILRNGDTYKAFTVDDPSLRKFVAEVLKVLKPYGATNVQLRMRNGIPYIFEFNARCSGTTYSRALCGFNEPLMIANYLLRGQRPVYVIRELTILRYWKELAVDNTRIAEMRETGVIDGIGLQL